jgi:hypothetical protein
MFFQKNPIATCGGDLTSFFRLIGQLIVEQSVGVCFSVSFVSWELVGRGFQGDLNMRLELKAIEKHYKKKHANTGQIGE